MARCDEGYRCEVCGEPVDSMTDSDLYLRYILGEIAWAELNKARERHIRCNPVQAQFIVDTAFEPVLVTGMFDKREFDAAETSNREELVTRAWRRLQELAGSSVPLAEYPLKTASRTNS